MCAPLSWPKATKLVAYHKERFNEETDPTDARPGVGFRQRRHHIRPGCRQQVRHHQEKEEEEEVHRYHHPAREVVRGKRASELKLLGSRVVQSEPYAAVQCSSLPADRSTIQLLT